MNQAPSLWLHVFCADHAAAARERALSPLHVRGIRDCLPWIEASQPHGARPLLQPGDCLALVAEQALPAQLAKGLIFSQQVEPGSRLLELWFPGFFTSGGFAGGPSRSGSLPFPLARAEVRRLGLRSVDDWVRLHKAGLTPKHIPGRPDRVYRHAGWFGWADFFGQEKLQRRRKHPYPTYEEIRAFFRRHRLPYGGKSGYLAYRAGKVPKLPRCPRNFPTRPNVVYGTDWKGWDDLLGVAPRVRRIRSIAPFEEARAFVRSLRLANVHQFQLWRVGKIPGLPVRPDNIPSNPQVTYQNRGWCGYGDFLGTPPRGPSPSP